MDTSYGVAVTESGLSIGDLSEQTGVPAATLRTWEARYGFPQPHRLPGGHRRYSRSDVAKVAEVLRHRAGGMSLEGAVTHAGLTPAVPERSVFAGLRSRFDQLTGRRLRKRTLLALTRAIEDECCARASSPVLFASFQTEAFYRQSRERWEDLARTAAEVVVFGDFERHGSIAQRPARVRTGPDAPLRREWMLVCDSPDHPACMTGWEVPGQAGTPDLDRRYEVLWTVDPRVVRHAARICTGLVATLGTERHSGLVGRLENRLQGEVAPASADLLNAQELFARIVGYVDRA